MQGLQGLANSCPGPTCAAGVSRAAVGGTSVLPAHSTHTYLLQQLPNRDGMDGRNMLDCACARTAHVAK